MIFKKLFFLVSIILIGNVLVACTVDKPKPFILPKSSLFKNPNTYEIFYDFKNIDLYQDSVWAPRYMENSIRKAWEVEDLLMLQSANSDTLKTQDNYNQKLLSIIKEASWIKAVSFIEIDDGKDFIRQALNRYDGADYQILISALPVVRKNNFYNILDFRIYSHNEYMKNRVFDLQRIKPIMRIAFAVKYDIEKAVLSNEQPTESADWGDNDGEWLEKAMRLTTQKALEQFQKNMGDPYTVHDDDAVIDVF